MGSFFSKDNGSLRSVTEIFAFPYMAANRFHTPTQVEIYNGVKYATVGEGEKAIVFCHGNCCTVDNRMKQLFKIYAQLANAKVYLVEYPGYGESNTSVLGPTADSCVDALSQIIGLVLKTHSVNKVFLMGHSIGTGVVAQFVYKNKNIDFGGMILVSPYKSILSVVLNDVFEETSSSFNFYKTQNIIEDIKVRILILHGIHDEVIDIEHSKVLESKNNNVSFISIDSDHDNILNDSSVINLVSTF